MKFNFAHLGGIDKGTVELGDLTVICGPNNMGKTYISYAIYGLLRHFKQWIDLSVSRERLAQLRDEGTLLIELTDYQAKLADYLKNASSDFSENLPRYFNVPEDFFNGAKAEFSHDQLVFDFTNEFKQAVSFGQSEQLSFYKAENETVLSVTFQTKSGGRVPNQILDDVISDHIADCLFADLLPRPFVVTSERTGIALFYKELDISKNAIIEHITSGDKVNPIDLLNSMRSRYAQPIHDNINVVREYENLCKRKSFIREESDCKPIKDALQDLMGGSYKAVDKQVMYMPKKERGRDKVAVPVYVASSSIKSLFLIDLYINSLAEKNGMLIIDEPELNLHPDNQRKMAGLLARLVNSGVKVLVTTHSDYLIRELNNRVMLNLDVENKEQIMKSAKMTDLDLLKPEQIKAYSLKDDHLIHTVEVDKYGINMEVFDNLIADANELADKIYYGIKEWCMLEAMKKIINPDVVINYDSAKKQLKLKEDGADSKVAELYIEHIPGNALAFTLDYQPQKDKQKFKQLSLYVNSTNDVGVNKGCDLIILWQDTKHKRALVFDLKSDKPKAQMTQKQLDNSELFLKYLLSMAAVHYRIDTDGIKIDKAIVTTNARNMRKRTTYQPNAETAQVGNYKIESVVANSSRTACVSLRKLISA